MAGSWSVGGSWLEFTGGDFAGDGAFTVAALTRPTFGNSGMAEWLAGGVGQMAFLTFAQKLFGRADSSSGFGNFPLDAWYVFAVTKAAGPGHYRMHAWAYASDESGVMAHGESAGAADHANFAAATSIRVGTADGVGGVGAIALAAAWDRALSDAELNTLVSATLSDWTALSPDFGVELSGWDGNAGPVVFAGSSAFSGETGAVAVAANPPGFNFTAGPPNQPPTVNAGPDQATTTGNLVTLTASGLDADGTVASYAWSQVSGPAVALSGAGAARTFTPATAGVRVFSVQAFDDDGAASTADTVTVTSTDPVVVAPPSEFLLDDGDMAYMRSTQAEARPTEGALYQRLEKVPDGLGGSTTGYPALDDGQPVQVRIVRVNDNTASDDVPRDLAGRYGVTDLRKVVMDLVAVRPGDLLRDVDRDRWYELVSAAQTEEWTTAHIVWAAPTSTRPAA